MDIAITRMSSKGQIVIPKEMRKGIKEGEKILLVKDDNKLVLKTANKLDEELAEDIAFAKRTEEALERMKKGKGIKMDFNDFISEMKKW